MASSPSDRASAVRLGVIGLGRAFMLTLPALRADPRIRFVSACDPRPEARRQFEAEFGGRAYADVAGLCGDPDTEAVYIATPHQMHAEHATAVAQAGKHILLEKPLAVSMEEATRIVEAAERAGVQLIVGPSHSFDAPVAQAHQLIESGELGAVRMIQAFNYTDFLYRPRRPEELRTSEGGGVVFSQGVHQIDIVRLLAGGLGRDITALTGAWDPDRPTEGAYSALMTFASGCFASLTYSGYAHFDSDVWMDNVGELGHRKKPESYGQARRALGRVTTSDQEIALKTARTYGAGSDLPPADTHEHFGPIIVLCERGDIQLTPSGLHIHGDVAREFRPSPTRRPRAEVIDALVGALRLGRSPIQTGRWALASLEVCHAILASAAAGTPVRLTRQVAVAQPEPDRGT